jgi:hypothetical protein
MFGSASIRAISLELSTMQSNRSILEGTDQNGTAGHGIGTEHLSIRRLSRRTLIPNRRLAAALQ